MSAFTTLMTPQGMQGLGALVFPKADPFEMNGFSRVSTGARRVVMAPSEQQLMALIMKERQDRFAQEGFSRVKNPSRIMTATGPQDFKTADELFRKSEEMSVKVGVANNIQGSAQRYRRSREVLIDAINSYKKEVGDETLTDIQVIKALNERNPREAFSDNEVVWTKPLRSSEVRAVGVQDKDSPLAYKTAEEYVRSKFKIEKSPTTGKANIVTLNGDVVGEVNTSKINIAKGMLKDYPIDLLPEYDVKKLTAEWQAARGKK
jgi:predicted lactoylglutathione lyase